MDAAECIAGYTGGVELPSVGSLSGPVAGEELVNGSGRDVTASGQSGIENKGRKRRRVDSLHSSISQPLIGLIRGETEATEVACSGGAREHDVRQAAKCMNKAIMAKVKKLEKILGGYLFSGADATLLRQREKKRGMKTITDTVRLHLAPSEGADFMLEVWLCSAIRKTILQVTIESAEDWRDILGDHLFEGMITSKWRKKEETKGLARTKAVNLSFHGSEDGSDCKLEVTLSFRMGKKVLADLYLDNLS